jgi:transposase
MTKMPWCSKARKKRSTTCHSLCQNPEKYAYGTINHLRFALSTGSLEGINMTIKVINCKAYGFQVLNTSR